MTVRLTSVIFPDTSKNPADPCIGWERFLQLDPLAKVSNSALSKSGSCGILFAGTIVGTINVFLSTVPPSVVGANPENLTVVVNNFISLTCEVTGFPPPDLSWLKNGKPLSSNANAFVVPGETFALNFCLFCLDKGADHYLSSQCILGITPVSRQDAWPTALNNFSAVG